jgi:hypothetical protein
LALFSGDYSSVLHNLAHPEEGVPQILWLDGHAHGDLDAVWQHLFQTTPIRVKQYQNNNNNQQQQQLVENVIVVNTMSAIGDEGYGRIGRSYPGEGGKACLLRFYSSFLSWFKPGVNE